jgi:mRNA-degrading endonuclease RelE of RelBE toxin-antitoxin system
MESTPDDGDADEEPVEDDEGVDEYRVFLKVTAAERLEAVEPRQDRFVLRARIAALIGNPRPPKSECLPGYTDHCRLRHRGFRILYSIDEAQKIVRIVGLGYRRL